MIPVVDQKRDVMTSGAEGSASFEISMDDAAHIMTILRDTLYSDKVLAVLREYSANAWDANRSNGNGDVPIKVTLPTYSDSTLKIKDQGPGLSVDDVLKVYNKYGKSTKRDSNDGVGMLGIGSKSGFAYSDSFTIISCHGGFKATFVAVIDASEKGRVDLLDLHMLGHNDKGEPDPSLNEDVNETGIEIQIPIKPADIGEFQRKAQTLFAFFSPHPAINVTLPPMPKGKLFDGLGLVVETVDQYSQNNGSWTAVMGCIPYRVNLAQLTGLSSSARNLSGILHFEVGSLQFSASREDLKYGDATKERLVERINTLIDKYIEHLLEGIDKLNGWERRLRIRFIKNMYLTVPGELKAYEDHYLQFKKDPAFQLKTRGWKGKLSSADGFKVSNETRLVFRDERKILQGYALQAGDLVVDPLLDVYNARKALDKQIIDLKVDGIPIVKISSIPWVRPATAPRQVDAARAKASCLVLDPTRLHADRKSERWIPTLRQPLDTDVWVVLDSYVVENLSDFYESYENDQTMLEAPAIGGKMPQIIGYRHTKAHPVDRSKLKGKEYKFWRNDEYVKLLLAKPGVADGVAARVWSNIASYSVYKNHVDRFGEGHPVGVYMAKVLKGTHDFVRTSKAIQSAIYRVFQSLTTNVAETEWKVLVARYPLLAVAGHTISIFAGPHQEQWFGYIKMVDFHLEMTENFQDTEQEQAA